MVLKGWAAEHSSAKPPQTVLPESHHTDDVLWLGKERAHILPGMFSFIAIGALKAAMDPALLEEVPPHLTSSQSLLISRFSGTLISSPTWEITRSPELSLPHNSCLATYPPTSGRDNSCRQCWSFPVRKEFCNLLHGRGCIIQTPFCNLALPARTMYGC
jgi:hypothetical protein